MALKKLHWIGIIFGAIVIIVAFIFFLNKVNINIFYFMIGLGLAIGSIPFVVDVMLENKKEQEKRYETDRP